MLLNKWVSLYHHSGIVFTTNYDSEIRPALWIKRDSSSFLRGHCHTLPNNLIFKLLIRNNSQGRREDNWFKGKWNRRIRDKNWLFGIKRGEIHSHHKCFFIFLMNLFHCTGKDTPEEWVVCRAVFPWVLRSLEHRSRTMKKALIKEE